MYRVAPCKVRAAVRPAFYAGGRATRQQLAESASLPQQPPAICCDSCVHGPQCLAVGSCSSAAHPMLTTRTGVTQMMYMATTSCTWIHLSGKWRSEWANQLLMPGHIAKHSAAHTAAEPQLGMVSSCTSWMLAGIKQQLQQQLSATIAAQGSPWPVTSVCCCAI